MEELVKERKETVYINEAVGIVKLTCILIYLRRFIRYSSNIM